MRVPVILQGEAADCGLACIAMVASSHDLSTSIHELRARYGSSAQGVSLFELNEILTDVGFTVRGLQVELQSFSQLNLPAIVHWSGNHFVVLEKVDSTTLTIIDPAVGRTTLSLAHAKDYVSGYVLEVQAAPLTLDIRRNKEQRGLSILRILQTNRRIWPQLLAVLLASLAFQLLSLTIPYLVSLVIDKAVTPRDTETLKLITFVFAGFFAAKILFIFINIRLQSNLTFAINVAITSKVTRHLLALPYKFFLMRGAADIYARTRTIDAIQIFFNSGVFEAPFSLLFSFVAMAVLFFLQPQIAFVALAFIVVTIIFEFPAQYFLAARQKRKVIAEIEEAKVFVSAMLRIDHIKLNSAESAAFAEVGNLQHQRMAASRELEISQHDVNGIVEALALLQKLVLVYLLADAAIDGKISVGLAVAFLLFTDEIKSRLLTVVHVWSALKATRVQLERVDEVVNSLPEFSKVPSVKLDRTRIAFPTIELIDVGFAYSKFGDSILRDINLFVQQNDKIVLKGQSGSGKSTLLKVCSTLVPPSTGSIEINGEPADEQSLVLLRKKCGGFFAEDRLTDGTILSNLLADTTAVEESEISKALEVTRLELDMAYLESGLNTLITADGRGLSSGQVQRILLAKAILRKPEILLLDEPTSHCDAETTKSIVAFLTTYPGTVIVTTHELLFSTSGWRVGTMTQGRLTINDEVDNPSVV